MQGRGKAAEFQRAGNPASRLAIYVLRANFELLRAFSGPVETAPATQAPPHREAVPAPDPALHDFAAPGGCVVRPSNGADNFLILIPAFNEEGAIGDVVAEVRQVMPNVPVLVVDDASKDATYPRAIAAGADVLRVPYHLGLGGCVQAGYKLAYELGYHYVIRVDGDGQHDPRYIPDLLKVLRTTGCHMVIGSRFYQDNGAHTSAVRAIGIWVFRAGAAADPRAARCAIPPPASSA